MPLRLPPATMRALALVLATAGAALAQGLPGTQFFPGGHQLITPRTPEDFSRMTGAPPGFVKVNGRLIRLGGGGAKGWKVTTTIRPAYALDPLPKARDAWAVYPAYANMRPRTDGLDAYDWEVAAQILTLGTAMEGHKAVIDPVAMLPASAERGPEHTFSVSMSALTSAAATSGAQHLLVQTVGKDSRMSIALADRNVSWVAREIAPARPLPAQGAARVAVEYALESVRQLAGAAPPSALTTFPDLPEPVDPVTLVARIEAATARLSKGPVDAATLATTGADLALLGWVLREAATPLATRCLTRGRALVALASLHGAAPAQLAPFEAFTLLLARHAQQAHDALAPLRAGDAAQQALAKQFDAAIECRPEPAKQPLAMLLALVAAQRLNARRPIEQLVPAVTEAHLPLELALEAEFPRLDLALVHRLAPVHALLIADPAAKDLKADAARLSASIPGQSTAGVFAAALAERAAALAAEAKPRSTTFEESAPGLTAREAHRARVELAAAPAVEYAHAALWRWGVPEEAKLVLEALDRHFPDSERLMFFESFGDVAKLDPAKESDRLTRALEWMNRDSDNPWKTHTVMGRGRLPAAPEDSSSQALVHGELELLGPTVTRAVLTPLLAADPYDPELIVRALELDAPALSAVELRERITGAVARYPSAASVAVRGARLLLARGCAQAADAVLRAATRAPGADEPTWTELLQLHRRVLRFELAGTLVDLMRDSVGPGLAVADAYAVLGERWINIGDLKRARTLLEKARAVEEWKGDVMLAWARLLIREGKAAEGAQELARFEERYHDAQNAITTAIGAHLTAGNRERAVAIYRERRSEILASRPIAAAVAGMFVFYGIPESAEIREQAGLPALPPKPAEDREVTKDPAVLRETLDAARQDRRNAEDYVLVLIRRRSPYGIQAVLDAVVDPVIGAVCARVLAAVALVDLELSATPGSAELARAQSVLATWWATAKTSWPPKD